ncbi:MarR family transcriptional regulator [Kocuria sp. ZOR0020]|uniref:MarR family transcriptional regulator n=1 Tax=Kocuria sp. ZOR0020 TaxID=1339234 RepID=UPI0012E05232|nr:MarR family transcriptional regulator [Kocuria sp. ZOR0020]
MMSHQTQAQIATRLGVSRPTVSRLLEEAREAGLVSPPQSRRQMPCTWQARAGNLQQPWA